MKPDSQRLFTGFLPSVTVPFTVLIHIFPIYLVGIIALENLSVNERISDFMYLFSYKTPADKIPFLLFVARFAATSARYPCGHGHPADCFAKNVRLTTQEGA
ncbi:hypothetical protein BRYFOR_08764 [Marvinbryantia formatexigens DSM 14469]|uniref:Uncharacterized protein n=1 Tax=Marvinbryantia formatexigens DSM 14469 TaxID=478749 RepID=C6LJC8_9FIRM|nr:hypothetical protein BRYFOR_08764 [Marvinbryantia formatexigens DSM 14469]